jgi:TolA-binding protein
MSESMAFIGGVAVAGLAALLLLKGTNTPIQTPNFAVPQMSAPIMQPQPVQQPPYSSLTQPVTPNQPQPSLSADQRLEMERQKMQLEQLKSNNEQLRLQNQQLQNQVQNLTQQLWNQNYLASNRTPTVPQPAAYQPQQTPWWSSPIVWAVGGMTLTIGGGVVVAGVLSLFSPKQRHTRTVQVIPYTGNNPPLVPVRRAEYLPPRVETARRMESPEYDEV